MNTNKTIQFCKQVNSTEFKINQTIYGIDILWSVFQSHLINIKNILMTFFSNFHLFKYIYIYNPTCEQRTEEQVQQQFFHHQKDYSQAETFCQELHNCNSGLLNMVLQDFQVPEKLEHSDYQSKPEIFKNIVHISQKNIIKINCHNIIIWKLKLLILRRSVSKSILAIKF